MRTTPNYKLPLIDPGDSFGPEAINQGMETIDTTLKEKQDTITDAQGKVTTDHLPVIPVANGGTGVQALFGAGGLMSALFSAQGVPGYLTFLTESFASGGLISVPNLRNQMGLGLSGPVPVTAGGTGVTDLASLVAQLNANGAARVATGSYVGTGAGSVTLAFDFAPKVVIIFGNDIGIFVHPNSKGWTCNLGLTGTASWQGNTLTVGSSYQMFSLNTSGATYHWCVLG